MPHPGRPKGRMNKKTQQALAQSQAEALARAQAQNQSQQGRVGINQPYHPSQSLHHQQQFNPQQFPSQHNQQPPLPRNLSQDLQNHQHQHHQQQQQFSRQQNNPIKEESGGQLHDEADLISFRNDALYRYITNHEYIENVTAKLIHTNKITPPSLYPVIPKRTEDQYDDLKPEDVYFGDLELMKDVDVRLRKKLSIMNTEDDPNYKAYLFDIDNYKFQKDKVQKLTEVQRDRNLDQETLKTLENELNDILRESREKYNRQCKTYPATRLYSISIKNINSNLRVEKAPENYDPRSSNAPILNQNYSNEQRNAGSESNNNNNNNNNSIHSKDSNGGLSSEIDTFANNLDTSNVNEMNNIFHFDNDDDDHIDGIDNEQPFDLNLNTNNETNALHQQQKQQQPQHQQQSQPQTQHNRSEIVKTNANDVGDIGSDASLPSINRENLAKNQQEISAHPPPSNPVGRNSNVQDRAQKQAQIDARKPVPSPPALPSLENELLQNDHDNEPPIYSSVPTNQDQYSHSKNQYQNQPQPQPSQLQDPQTQQQTEDAIMDNLFNDNVDDLDPSAVVNDDIGDLYNFGSNNDDNLMNSNEFEQDFFNEINQGMN